MFKTWMRPGHGIKILLVLIHILIIRFMLALILTVSSWDWIPIWALRPATSQWRIGPLTTFKRLLIKLTENNASVISPIAEVGERIKVTVLKDPFDNAIGLIQET